MKAQRIVLAIVLADFVGLTVYALAQVGFAGFIAAATANIATVALTADLVIALGLISAWMWRDAERRGVSVVPHLLLTLGFGSVGPLVYLLQRPTEADEPAGRVAVRAA